MELNITPLKTKFNIGDIVHSKTNYYQASKIYIIEDFIYFYANNDWYVKFYYYNNAIDENTYMEKLKQFEEYFELVDKRK